MSSSCFGGRRNKETNEKVIVNGFKPNGFRVVNKEMCFYCFDIILHNLGLRPMPIEPELPSTSYPLFVSWSTGRDKELRGCIGTFSNQPLSHGLKEYAISSAFRDTRFQPVSKHEVHKLHCSVSLLTNFEYNYKYHEWIVGTHGIRIEFSDDKGHTRSATYLPEVAHEQGWDHRTTIDSLMRKSGYHGTITEELRMSIKLTRYQSEKCIVSYQEYVNYASVPGNNMNGYANNNSNHQW